MAEKFKVRRKLCIDLADVAADEMPKCSTPDGEDTEVHITSVGRSPHPQSHSHSRANSWSWSPDLEADTPVDTAKESAAGGIVSKVMAMFRPHNTDEGAKAMSSVVVGVETLGEKHIDPELRQWRKPKHASPMGQNEDLETGL